MSKATIHDLDALRRYLGQNAPFLGAQAGRATGISALDGLLSRDAEGGGLPKGALAVLGGAPGSGRAHLAARVLARETDEGRPVAWVDTPGTLYPPALAQAGVALERLLVVRSEPDRALYAAEQLLGSGAFRFVVMGGLGRHLSGPRARRLQTAAEGSEACGLLLMEPDMPRVPGLALELELERKPGGAMVTVKRDRLGPSGRRAFVALREDAGAVAA